MPDKQVAPNGYAATIPSDMLGRTLFALEKLGPALVILLAILYQTTQVTESITAERKEGDRFIREKILSMNEALSRQLAASESEIATSTAMRRESAEAIDSLSGVIERNTSAIEKLSDRIDRIVDAPPAKDSHK